MTKSDPSLVFSENFQAADADVVYCSSDGVRFRIHSKNLAITSGVLNPGTMDLQAEVHLTEPANILELLFQCVYPRRQSDISQLSSEDLFALGEAVEKYEIFPAMELCRLYIKTLAQSHPILTLGFGFKHGYPDLVDDAALYTMNYPLSTVVSALPDHAVLPWLDYRQALGDIMRHRALELAICYLHLRPGCSPACGECETCLYLVLEHWQMCPGEISKSVLDRPAELDRLCQRQFFQEEWDRFIVDIKGVKKLSQMGRFAT